MTEQEYDLIHTIRSSDNPTDTLRYALMLLIAFQDRASAEQDTEFGLQVSAP